MRTAQLSQGNVELAEDESVREITMAESGDSEIWKTAPTELRCCAETGQNRAAIAVEWRAWQVHEVHATVCTADLQGGYCECARLHVSSSRRPCVALLPVAASAQTSAIGGTVKDTSGAVLPGVTVEASSPALIEKSAIGRHRRLRACTRSSTLRPGTYTVTFTLPGFSVVKRENVELTSDFTATINADLKVGAVAETITVSAESPDRRHAEHHDAHGHDARGPRRDPDRPQHPGGRHHDSRARPSRWAAAARCRATSADRATSSSRRCSTAARPTPCRRSKGCA